MTNFNFYHSLSDEAKEVLRSLMPEGWKPPPDLWNKNLDMEGPKELEKIMKEVPKNVKRESGW